MMERPMVGMGRDYIRKACEVLGIEPTETASVIVHFDPQDFVWVEIKQFLSVEKADKVMKLLEGAKDQVPA